MLRLLLLNICQKIIFFDNRIYETMTYRESSKLSIQWSSQIPNDTCRTPIMKIYFKLKKFNETFNKKLNVWKPKFCKQIIYDVWWIELRGTSSRKAPWKITHITFYQIFFKTINRSCQMTFSISKKNESKSKYLVKSSIILWTISSGLQ